MTGQNPGKSITPLVLAFLAGVVAGANWPKIKKQLKPLLESVGEKTGDVSDTVVRFFAEQKEKLEDKAAAAKVSKKAKSSKGKGGKVKA